MLLTWQSVPSWKTSFQNIMKHHDVIERYFLLFITEPPHDKTNKMACAPSVDSDQPGHLSSLIDQSLRYALNG